LAELWVAFSRPGLLQVIRAPCRLPNVVLWGVVELLFAAERAEEIRPVHVLAGDGRLLVVEPHAAHWVNDSPHGLSYLLAGAWGGGVALAFGDAIVGQSLPSRPDPLSAIMVFEWREHLHYTHMAPLSGSDLVWHAKMGLQTINRDILHQPKGRSAS